MLLIKFIKFIGFKTFNKLCFTDCFSTIKGRCYTICNLLMTVTTCKDLMKKVEQSTLELELALLHVNTTGRIYIHLKKIPKFMLNFPKIFFIKQGA